MGRARERLSPWSTCLLLLFVCSGRITATGFFFLWDAQLLSTVLPNPLGMQLGSFSQNKLQGTRDRDKVYSGKQLVAEGVGDWVFFQTPGK